MTNEEEKEATSSAGAAGIEQWDLTPAVSPYLDRHMIFPLLEFLDTLIATNGSDFHYTTQDVAAARLALLRPTHMVDYAMDVYQAIHGGNAPVPAELQEQKQTVYQQLKDLKAGCQELLELTKDTDQRVCIVYYFCTSVEIERVLSSLTHTLPFLMLSEQARGQRTVERCGSRGTQSQN